MSEQQYRVVKDRDKGDRPVPQDLQATDRYVLSGPFLADTRIVRIERPVPTTDEPMDVFQAEAQRARGVQPSPHPPTREQIAEVLTSWFPEYEGVGSVIEDAARALALAASLAPPDRPAHVPGNQTRSPA